MADTKGKMHCRTCAQRVTAKLNVSATQFRSNVFYAGHTGKDAAGKKVKCPGTTVRFSDDDFPGWARDGLNSRRIPLA